MNSSSNQTAPTSPNDLKRDLQGLARTRSVEDLQKRGIKQVKIASLDHVLELVQQAVERTAAADDPLPAANGDVQPDLIRIRRSLSEVVPQLERPDHRLQQVSLSGLQHWNLRSQRCVQFTVHRPSLLDAEDVDAHAVFEQSPVGFDRFRAVQ